MKHLGQNQKIYKNVKLHINLRAYNIDKSCNAVEGEKSVQELSGRLLEGD